MFTFGIQNSLRLPIKGGPRGRVKGFTTFEAETDFRETLSPCFYTLSCIRSGVLCSGTPSNFRTPQQGPEHKDPLCILDQPNNEH
jgi:hypothetical protein